MSRFRTVRISTTLALACLLAGGVGQAGATQVEGEAAAPPSSTVVVSTTTETGQTVPPSVSGEWSGNERYANRVHVHGVTSAGTTTVVSAASPVRRLSPPGQLLRYCVRSRFSLSSLDPDSRGQRFDGLVVRRHGRVVATVPLVGPTYPETDPVVTSFEGDSREGNEIAYRVHTDDRFFWRVRIELHGAYDDFDQVLRISPGRC